MKRKFDTLFVRNEQEGYRVGDEAAHRAAAALADKVDAPTIQRLTAMVDFFELIGGQCHIVTAREKFDRHGNRVGEDDDGEWATTGLVFHFETRDLRVVEAQAPEEIHGLPVTDSQEPPVVIAPVEASQPVDPGDLESEEPTPEQLDADVEEDLENVADQEPAATPE